MQITGIMKTSFLIQLLRALSPEDQPRLRKFLQSPYFNHRSDVLILYEFLLDYRKNDYAGADKTALFARVYPGDLYDNRKMNHLVSDLTTLVERFFTFEEIRADEALMALRRCRALRKRGVVQLFERDLNLLERRHRENPYRDSAYFLYEYELQNERYAWEALRTREAHVHIPKAAGALAGFFMLENLRWACTAQSVKAVSAVGREYAIPLSETVLSESVHIQEADNPALSLLRQALLTLGDNENETHFQRLEELLHRYIHLLPPPQARDIFMAAINFAIRRHNRGEVQYTKAALALYREALDRNVLTENGLLPKYTFINIFNLAQLGGERDWALAFIDRYRGLLPAADRENIHRYCLAGWHFRKGDYPQVLELLRSVEFTEVFINLDVRKMLLRSYFELGEWPALDSLLDSFGAYLKRQKHIGYHREGYLNLIRFTKKLARAEGLPRARAKVLANRIRETKFVTEREWLLEKI